MSFSGLLFNEFRYDGLFEFSFGFSECKVNFIHLLKWILEKQKIYIKNKLINKKKIKKNGLK